MQQRGFSVWAISLVAIGFGLLTIKEGGTILFGDEAARSAAGNYVPFVLWFNFVAGFAYVVAGAGLWSRRRWAARLAIAIAVATALAFAAFGVHVLAGGAYELRTVVAMSLRTLVWTAIAWIARRASLNGSSNWVPYGVSTSSSGWDSTAAVMASIQPAACGGPPWPPWPPCRRAIQREISQPSSGPAVTANSSE